MIYCLLVPGSYHRLLFLPLRKNKRREAAVSPAAAVPPAPTRFPPKPPAKWAEPKPGPAWQN